MSHQEYVGRTELRTDTVWPLLLRGLSATLDVPEPEHGVLPPLWHWMLFQDWAPAHGLGPDGHPKRGGFLPPVHDLPRRMWAGGRVRFHAPLHAGEIASRTSTILSVQEKTGGSGRLVFVTVRHEIEGPGGLAIVEEHDIVYRGAEGEAVKAAPAAPPLPAGAFSRAIVPDPVLLFRYSALTGNGHRIHYDLDYVTREEGYPGLIVHGPLQATLLADLARRQFGRGLKSFTFRGRRPAFHNNAMTLCGWQDAGAVKLETRDHEGAVCMTAEAVLA
ncbi:MAG: MaoC family dehydratase N-terminal domain-containing protein [Proteobacteria bacterium]|nr:MaoC family dehydratase N-terminal domain-containing protein [Pseudomonadota bacterium]